jgi:hypothetical protein
MRIPFRSSRPNVYRRRTGASQSPGVENELRNRSAGMNAQMLRGEPDQPQMNAVLNEND